MSKSSEVENVKNPITTKKENQVSFLPNLKQETFADLVLKYGCELVQGAEIWEETLSFTKILSTGCKSIDNILNGGIFTGELTEIFGPPSSGKTQFAFSLIANTMQTDGYNVLYLDTNCSSSMTRIKEILTSKNKESVSPIVLRELLFKLRVAKLHDIFQLFTLLDVLKEKLVKGADQFALRLKLIIVDSIHSLISPLLGGIQAQGHSLMMQLSMLLKELAYDYGIAVVAINGIVTQHQQQATQRTFKPALGKYWHGVPQVRLCIDFASKKDFTLRSLVIDRHSRLPSNRSKALFRIADKGFSS